jgi:cysteine desulfurase
LPVHLIAGLGEAARLAATDHALRLEACRRFRERLLLGLQPLRPVPVGDQSRTLPNVIALMFPGLDSEAVMLAVKDFVAISNGSACTSASYSESHVLKAMGMPPDQIGAVTRWSWCHTTNEPDWPAIVDAIQRLY